VIVGTLSAVHVMTRVVGGSVGVNRMKFLVILGVDAAVSRFPVAFLKMGQ